MILSGSAARASEKAANPPQWMIWMPEQDLLGSFEMLQGYCFPDPAWRMCFWAGKDRGYLARLSGAIEKHDAYLWRTRDSNGDGLLETWCVWDTGEDHSSRLVTRNALSRWPFDFAPIGDRLPDTRVPAHYQNDWFDRHVEKLPPPAPEQVMVPFASMEMADAFSKHHPLNPAEFWAPVPLPSIETH